MATSALFTAVSALQAEQQFISVIANNLANINTTGFKGSRVLFSDALSQTLREPTIGGGLNAGANGIQIGLGTEMGSVTPYYTQGALQSTGLNLDLAIEGGGFFTVADPIAGTSYYTRDGAFNLAQTSVAGVLGVLSTGTGQRVQGAAITAPASSASDGDALGDIDIATSYTSPLSGLASNTESISIDSQGRVMVTLEDGSSLAAYQLGMQNFSNPQALDKVGSNLYLATAAAGKQFPIAGADVFQTPGTSGLGQIRSGYLEQSNVDIGQEFSDLIRGQRALEAASKVITTTDEIMNTLINMKR